MYNGDCSKYLEYEFIFVHMVAKMWCLSDIIYIISSLDILSQENCRVLTSTK